MSQKNQLQDSITIIQDKLYWISTEEDIYTTDDYYVFSTDKTLASSFSSSQDPLDLSKITKYIISLRQVLKNPKFNGMKIYHQTFIDENKRSNAALLMCAFQIVILKKSAEESWKSFENVQPPLAAFTETSSSFSTQVCTILDCLKGLEQAIHFGWYKWRKFDCKSYEYYSRSQGGQLNWIIPEKFAAFRGPCEASSILMTNNYSPEKYVRIFEKLKIKSVVRLNRKLYDEKAFENNGIRHHNLSFDNNADPSGEIIKKFILTCKEEKGAIGVHCRNGLGQTGLLIACYALAIYQFKAASFIGWIRLCRPGSIDAIQREFLLSNERNLQGMGNKLGYCTPLSIVIEAPTMEDI